LETNSLLKKISMVMEAVPSPQCVGREFVRQYYTLLNKAPLHLHRFYNTDSSFVHGGLKEQLPEEVYGQQQIHQKIMELDFHDCKAKILLVDSHRTLDNGVVVQVSGELSNNGQPMRRFVQTFVLAPQSAKKYYVRNDIFRYQDDAFSDDEDGGEERSIESEIEPVQPARPAPVEMNHGHAAPAVAPLATVVAPVEVTGGSSHPPPGMNGSKHHEEEIRPMAAPSMTGTYPAVAAQPSEPVPAVAQPPKAATPAVEVPPPTEKVEEVPEPIKEPEPSVVVEPAPTKRAPEPTASAPSAPAEPKTYANLFKNPGAYNGTTPGVPTSLPPFGPAKSTPSSATPSTTPAQPNNDPTPASANINGSNENFPAAVPSQAQRNNFNRQNNTQRPMVTGNGRVGTGPGSYNNRDRDNERGEKTERWSDNRAPSRDSTEEIGEWKPSNGEGYHNKKYYDDNLQVFVGNIPHTTTEDDLKDLFEQFGKVQDVRILGKNVNNVRIGGGNKVAPLYAFVVFDSPKSAEAALAEKPLLNGDHRLNVEPKRRPGAYNSAGSRDQRGGSMNRGGMGGPGRGGRPMNTMGMAGPPRDGTGGGRGGMGRGGYMPRRQ